MKPEGTIVFSIVGIASYAFDVFSINLNSTTSQPTEHRHTDGVSVNFNAQFTDEGQSLTFITNRTGSLQMYQTRPNSAKPNPLPNIPQSLYHDRPVIKNYHLYFASAHEKPSRWFKPWSAVYRTDLKTNQTARLTPLDFTDFSPAVSQSGNWLAVATYGSRPWTGDFHDLNTSIAVFSPSDPSTRAVISNGGWPSFAGDSTVFFHRKADDGWWSVYRSDLAELHREDSTRVTPPGVHAFTPAAAHNGRWIAVATRRKGSAFRQIEIFDLETEKFRQLTALTNPNLHHYNPFISPESNHVGYHRYRGDSADGDSIRPCIKAVTSPAKTLKLLNVPTTFPSFSPNGDFIAVNGDFFTTPGLTVMKRNGTKRWTLMKTPSAFYTAWSPIETGVIYTSVGPIFESMKSTVQSVRVSFNINDLDERDEVTTEVKLLTRVDSGNNAFPSVSPDGKFVVFRSGRDGSKNVYIVDAVNGEGSGGEGIRRLTDGEWIDTMPSWSPDGELIAFSSNRHKPEDETVFSVYLIRPDGTGLRRIYVAGDEGSAEVDRERINHVCFSPDSEWLLFAANFGGVSAEPISYPNQFQPYGDLYVCRLDGSELRRLTCNPFENGTPAWSGSGGDLDVERISLGEVVGDKLGQFDEPLWLTCDV